ncbi:MAG: hypothetical protein JNN04_17150 [Cyclobacteriaceae bacterium]|nr:hypothetical protein [Cyclobacteriaceae bacterium]
MSTGWISNPVRLILMLGLSFPATAQVQQIARYEIPILERNEPRYNAVRLGIHGMMIYRRTIGKKDDQFELIKLDTLLREQWKGSITVSKKLDVVQTKSANNTFYMLLKDPGYIGKDFVIVAINQTNSSYRAYPVKNIIPFYPAEFVLTGKSALIGGYFNSRPLVLQYSFEQQSARILPGFFNSPGELDQIKLNGDGTTDIVVSARNFEKRRALWIRTYDAQGELLRTTILQPDEDKHLLFGRSIKLPDGRHLVAGIYGRFTEYSRGVFVALVDAGGTYSIKYYNFAELKNFFSYMRARQQQRVKERIERKTIKGKKIKFNYRLLVHDLIDYNNEFLLIGEAFYPHYVYPKNYNPQARQERIFDGYKYTHAVVIAFRKDAALAWDNSFEINDVKTYQLQQFVRVQPDKDKILLMYLFDNVVRTKIILNDQVLEGKTTEKIRTGADHEELDREEENTEKLDAWYGDYFYASGTQSLKGRRGGYRQVFFIHKITYR